MSKLGIGLLSSAYGHPLHYVMDLLAHRAVEFKAVAEYDHAPPDAVERSVACAKQYDVPFYTDYHEMLERDDIDIVVVMPYPRCKPEMIEAAASAGKHILSDKPHAVDVDGARRIVKAVEQAGVKFFLTLGQGRTPAPVQRVKKAIDDGTLGELKAIDCIFLPRGELKGFVPSPSFIADVGGGEVTNFGYYAIDAVLWLAGGEATEVYAEIETFFYDHYRQVGLDDFGQLSLKLDNGVVASITVGRPPTVSHPFAFNYQIGVTGSKGTIHARVGAGERISVYESDPPRASSDIFTPWPSRQMVLEFVDAILNDSPSPLDAHDALHVLEVIRAAYHSNDTHHPVMLPMSGS